VAAPEPTPLTWLINFIKPFRVVVTSTYGGNHVPSSWHYHHRAIDVAGSQQEMARLHRAALRNPSAFKEAFYDPSGKYIKNGQLRLGKIGGHSDHVHLAR
jgi:hypothetical protein